jgi:hypothetical protein
MASTDCLRNQLAQANDKIAEQRTEICHLLDEVEGMDNRVLRLKEAQRWVPVSERMPEKSGLCLAILDYKFCQCVEAITGDWFVNSMQIHNVTHWMPLPEPPEVEE